MLVARRHLFVVMAALDRETLLEELNRLLDVGEPLLTLFPRKYPGDPHNDWILQLPGSISDEMGWYALEVSWRAWNWDDYQDVRQRDTVTSTLKTIVDDAKAGLLGWRAIGVLD